MSLPERWTAEVSGPDGGVRVEVDERARTVTTRFPDGAEVVARPETYGRYRERAVELGYPDSEEGAWQSCKEHEAIHTWASHLLGQPYSPTLRSVATGRVAHPTRHEDVLGAEEDLVLELQCFLQTGAYGRHLRWLWWQGFEPEGIERGLRKFLRREES